MKTKLVYLFSITTSLFLASCSNDDDAVVDTQAPVIAVAEPHDEDVIAPGGEIHFEAMFTDNVELASYKIEIHNVFDDHTHSAVKQTDAQDNPWSYSEVFTIPAGQTSFEATNHIEIPTEINGQPVSEGAYHFGVYVTDAAGNEEQAFLELHIEGNAEGEEHVH